MKTLIKILTVAGTLFLALAGTAFAANEKSDLSPFVQAIQKTDYIMNKKVKLDADYFLVLCSASWCGPCRAEMPEISRVYREEIKENPDVELVLISFDHKESAMKTWGKQEKVKFPVTMRDRKENTIFGTETAFPRGIPHLFIFKADGTLVTKGHPGTIFKDYKKYTAEK